MDVQSQPRCYRGSAEAGPSRLPLQGSRPRKGARAGASRRRAGLACKLLAAFSAVSAAHAQSATPGPRWGQASALFGDYFVVHGGKTNGDAGGGGYTYTSGVNTGELLLLNLNSNFSTSSPPWSSINTTYSAVKSPAVAYHTITPILQGSQLLVFGGDVSSTSAANLTGTDSAYFLELTNYNTTAWWAASPEMNQPQRRIHHSADTDGDGALWIVGGERNDGSGGMFDEMWTMNDTATTPVFTRERPPNGGLVGNTATLLSDGTLLVLGGQKGSGMQTFYDITYYSMETGSWGMVSTAGANSSLQAFPAPRQGHVAVSLPHRRLLLHGGTSRDYTQALDDTWILDWSRSPPTWSQIAASSNAPSARFGHSAVARGDKVAFAFGWAGNNAADTRLYVFDASTLTRSSEGFWSGGDWVTNYTPDTAASTTRITGGSSNSKGNGSSTTGGKNTGSAGSSSGASSPGSSSTSPSDPFAQPSSTGGSDPSGGGQSNTTGAKAGAALGALLGVGLIAGAGFMVYRKRHPPLGAYRLNDGSDGAAGGLLRGSNHYYGADDDPYMLEKGRPYTGVGPGGIASFQQGTKPLGPRTAPSQPELLSTTMSMGNVGHAMEGSGPHFRERLALITGFGRRDAMGGRQQRFDMLADEDDYTHDAFALEEKREPIEEVEEEDDEYLSMSRRLREQSYYGQVEQADLDEDYDRSYVGGDLAGLGAGYAQGDYETSPFEDEEGGAGETTLLANATRSRDEENNDSHSLTQTIDTGDMTSNTSQSHANSNSTRSGQDSSSSAAAAAAAGIVSFSDSNGDPSSSSQRPHSNGNAPSSMMRRSPTWWDRFMGQSFLERSASGRLYPGPRAEEPIRDPAEPPALGAIRESPRSTDPSGEEGQSTFRDGVFASLSGADEMGRYVDPPHADVHSRSMSSLRSGRTMTSSVMNMDVAIRRVGTASSRKTHSTARSGSRGSDAPVSRSTSMKSSAGHRHVMDPGETPGSVIFDPNEWSSSQQVPRTVDEEEGSMAGGMGDVGNTSADITDLNYAPVLHRSSGGRKRSNTNDLAMSSPYVSQQQQQQQQQQVKRSKTVTSSAKMYGGGAAAKTREASDVPSITPSTTKRARQNRQLTAPVSPQPQRVVAAPVRGSVLDRVKAIEKRRNEAGEEILPIPRSPAVEPYSPGSIYSPEMERAHTFVPGRGGRPILTKISTREGGAAGGEADMMESPYLHLGEDSVMMSSPVTMRTPVHSTMMKPTSSSNSNGTSNGHSKTDTAKLRYSTGLVPKQQLFVANPDGRQASDDS